MFSPESYYEVYYFSNDNSALVFLIVVIEKQRVESLERDIIIEGRGMKGREEV